MQGGACYAGAVLTQRNDILGIKREALLRYEHDGEQRLTCNLQSTSLNHEGCDLEIEEH